MAALNDEQKAAVAQWAEEGATLNDIQSRLKETYNLTMTYMEARLLMMDLNVSLKDKAKSAAPASELPAQSNEVPAPSGRGSAQPPAAADAEEVEADEESYSEAAFGADGAETAGGGTFSMSADELAMPGMLVSGSASFSDGVSAKWYLDQMGRLSLKADKSGYQPPQADVPKFQQGLEKILAKMGLY